MVARSGRKKKWRMTANGYGVSFWGWWNVLELLMMVMKPCEWTGKHWTVRFIRVNFMVCHSILIFLKNNTIIPSVRNIFCRHRILLSNQLSEKSINWLYSNIRIVKPLIHKIRVEIEEGKKGSQREILVVIKRKNMT